MILDITRMSSTGELGSEAITLPCSYCTQLTLSDILGPGDVTYFIMATNSNDLVVYIM